MTLSICPPGTYDWVAARGTLEYFDQLFLHHRKWSDPVYSGYTGAVRLYEMLRGFPESPHWRRDFWLDTSDDPYKLALIGGNLLVYATGDAEKNDLPLRGATAEETLLAMQTMREIAALDWPVLKEGDHASTIREHMLMYERVEPGDEIFFSLV